MCGTPVGWMPEKITRGVDGWGDGVWDCGEELARGAVGGGESADEGAEGVVDWEEVDEDEE